MMLEGLAVDKDRDPGRHLSEEAGFMKLFEHMAKEVMARHGIPTPGGRVAHTPDQAYEAALELGRVAVKAQVLVGGRGKAGGIGFAETPEQARDEAARIIGMEIKGLRVEKVLVEQMLPVEKELYLGLIVDRLQRAPVMIASSKGGMAIEEVPEEFILRLPVDVRWGLLPHQAREIGYSLGLPGKQAQEAAGIALKLYEVFCSYDAELTEINPLVVSEGRVIAADSRLNVEDDSLYRHPELPFVFEGTELEREVKDIGLAFVQLDGDIAIMANGAGMAMATLDVVQTFGGKPANFLDAGGGASSEAMSQGIEALLKTKPRAILINIFGGITRCDDVARALVQVYKTKGIPVPVVVRLVGTNEAEGVDLLSQHGLSATRSLEEAARTVVSLANASGGVM